MIDDLTFHPITSTDLEFLNSIRNTYATEYLHDSRLFSLEETINWFNKISPNYWIIFYKNIKIGYFRLSNYSHENQSLYIGADISPDHKGKGYATPIYKLFIPFLFKKYNLNKISLEVLSTNTVAKNLYNKLGFTEEGTKRQEVYKNGKFIDSIIMSLLKIELEHNGYILEN